MGIYYTIPVDKSNLSSFTKSTEPTTIDNIKSIYDLSKERTRRRTKNQHELDSIRRRLFDDDEQSESDSDSCSETSAMFSMFSVEIGGLEFIDDNEESSLLMKPYQLARVGKRKLLNPPPSEAFEQRCYPWRRTELPTPV